MDTSLRKICCEVRKVTSVQFMHDNLFPSGSLSLELFCSWSFDVLWYPSLFKSYVVCILLSFKYLTLKEIPLKTHAFSNYSFSSKGLRTGNTMFRGDLSWKTVWKKMNRSPDPSDFQIFYIVVSTFVIESIAKMYKSQK